MKFVDALMAFLGRWLGWQGVPERQKSPPVASLPPAVPVYPPTAPETPPVPVKIKTMTKAQTLYNTAKASLGKDMSPLDKAPDSLACMESMDGVWFAAFGEHLLPLPARLSTQAGYEAMLRDPRLKEVPDAELGAIVISPTGYSTKGSRHGHTGCVGKFDIMSNDSNTGLWMDNYEKEAWIKVFHDLLGFPVHYFLPKD